MWSPVGRRPATIQNIKLSANQHGKLVGIHHNVIVHTSVMENFIEPSASQTRMRYACEACETSHKLVEIL